jgi:hypothetical protein
MSDSKTQLLYQEAARRLYDESSIRVEGNVMPSDDGAFVAAWVWVPKEALGNEDSL